MHVAWLLAPRARVIFNNCAPPSPLQSWSSLAEKVKAVLRDFPELELTEGRKVVEVRPSIMWDKGKAVEFLLRSLGKYVRASATATAHTSCMLPSSLSSSFPSLRVCARRAS